MMSTVIIGGGCAGLMSAYSLNQNGVSFKLLDTGNSLEKRDHNDAKDMTTGLGGAGLFSDGKFSFFPAGEKIWSYERKHLEKSYRDLIKVMNVIDVEIEDFPTEQEYQCMLKRDKEWGLKKYTVLYLTLMQRKNLINQIINGYQENILSNTMVTNITKDGSNYIVEYVNMITGSMETLRTQNIIMCGGRFMPFFTQKLSMIQHEFKRIELGFRLEGPNTNKLYNFTQLTDPKFIMRNNGNEYRTFCWCRNGETSCTKFPNPDGTIIETWSGRSDIIVTEKSNFGFNIRLKEEMFTLLESAMKTSSFDVVLNNETSDNICSSYREIYGYLIEGLKSFISEHIEIADIDLFDETYRIKGPTIEGVGYYPITDINMKVPGENIYICGDANGNYRGIIPSMISGSFVSYHLIESLKQMKKTVYFLSGKRFCGKTTLSNILKKKYGDDLLITSFSSSLKKVFCSEKSLDYMKFINDHDMKNKYRDELTEYFHLTDPMKYMYEIKDCIKSSEHHTIVIDDLRLKSHLDYIQSILMCDPTLNIQIIRINSSDDARIKRGWVKTSYDENYVECDLDDYNFENVVNNEFENVDDFEHMFCQIFV